MKIKSIFVLILSIVLFSCKDSEKISVPVTQQNEKTKEIKIKIPDQVFTIDGKLIGTVQSVKDSLNKRVLSKSRSLTKEDNEFMCDCFIKELRLSRDTDSLLFISLDKCTELLRIRRNEKNPNVYIYTKDGDFVGTKKTLKEDVMKELKEKKVRPISDSLLTEVVTCIGKKYSNMTTNEIKRHKDIFLECLMEI